MIGTLNASKSERLLFENFLNDKRIYTLNENYWIKLIRKIGSENNLNQDWLNRKFSNNVKFYDGNPIVSFKINENRAIRIIQEELEGETSEISAWIEKGVIGTITEELVVALELTDSTKSIAIELLEKWYDKNTTIQEMEEYIVNRI
jgi:hypothetical protein